MPSPAFRRCTSGAALTALLLLCAPALAAPSQAELDSARKLTKEAAALRKAGDDAGALAKYRAAHALAGTPETGLELGKACVRVGRLMEAREILASIQGIPVAAHESPQAARARREAGDLAGQLDGRIPSLQIELVGVPGSTVEVKIDGSAMPPDQASAPRRVDPGRHTIAARAPGQSNQVMTVDLSEGEQRVVRLVFSAPEASGGAAPAGGPAAGPAAGAPSSAAPAAAPALPGTPAPAAAGAAPQGPAPPPPPAAPAPSPAPAAAMPPPALAAQPPPPNPWERRSVDSADGGGSALPAILLGSGVVMLGVGAVTGALAIAKKSTVHQHCDAQKRCDAEGLAAADSGKTLSTISTVAFVGAGLSIGAWIAIPSGGSTSSRTSASVPSLHLEVAGRF